MKDREIGKGLFDRNSFEEGGLEDWLEQIAVDYVEGQYAGFEKDDAEEYATYVLRNGLTDDQQHHILTSLLSFPLQAAARYTHGLGQVDVDSGVWPDDANSEEFESVCQAAYGNVQAIIENAQRAQAEADAKRQGG